MKSTTKGFYSKNSKTLTNVSSPATSGNLKQVNNLIEDTNVLKYSIDDGETYKSVTDAVETQITSIISGTTPVAEATHATSADTATSATTATNATNAVNATNSTNAANLTGTIASGVTATTQPNTDNSTKVATTAFVQNIIGDINTLLVALDSGEGV